jgi:hypothetical protein
VLYGEVAGGQGLMLQSISTRDTKCHYVLVGANMTYSMNESHYVVPIWLIVYVIMSHGYGYWTRDLSTILLIC